MPYLESKLKRGMLSQDRASTALTYNPSFVSDAGLHPIRHWLGLEVPNHFCASSRIPLNYLEPSGFNVNQSLFPPESNSVSHKLVPNANSECKRKKEEEKGRLPPERDLL